MTGTGTKADPYIPETLTEWIQSCSIKDAYIHLIHDLNAADDPDYTGELETPILLNYVTVTSDGKHTIRGITVQAESFFNCKNGVSQIEDILFRDCVHIRTNTSTATLEGNYGRAGCGFQRCGIFMEIQCNDYGQLVGSAVGMADTTAIFVLKDTQIYASSLLTSDVSLTRCNVQFVGASVNGQLIAGRSYGTACWNTAAVRLKNARFCTDSVLLSNCGQYANDTYVYLEDPVLNDFSDVTVQLTDGDNCLVAADGAVTLDCSDAWTSVVPDVLKSPDALTETGWIPELSQSERLAEGFIVGAYLEASGEEYIMLPFIPDEKTRIHAKGRCVTGYALFGAGRRFAICSSPARNCQVIFYRDENTGYDTKGYPFGGEYEYDMQQDGKLYINGNYFTTMSSTDRGTPVQMSLFQYVNVDGKTYLNQAVLQYFYAYEDEIPVWELVPCVRLEDDAAGMYDKLTGAFFGNDGNGKLLTSWRYGENWGYGLWACRQNVNDGLPYVAGTVKPEAMAWEESVQGTRLKAGSRDVKRLYLGEKQVRQAYLSESLVY